MNIGTCYFVSLELAIRYYKPYGYDRTVIAQKLADGEIRIGEPPLKKNQRLRIIDGGTRYAIVED